MNFDFDKDLNAYATDWYERHKTLPPEEIEDAVGDVFEEWAERVIPALGTTPRAYFASMSDDRLFDEYVDGVRHDKAPSILLDEVCERRSLGPRLVGIVADGTEHELVHTAMSALEEQGNKDVYEIYLRWVLDDGADEELVLAACEIMQDDADLVRDRLLAAIPTASEKVKDRICDLIVYAGPCEAGFGLLLEKLRRGEDLPLYAAYLGKYGNPRAIRPLTELAQTCDYATFIEVRNSISMLGGELEVQRDFSDDETYRRIKGLPKKPKTGGKQPPKGH